MDTPVSLTTHPTPEQMWPVLLRISGLLQEPVCWLYEGGYHFRTGVDGWTLAVSPDSARRIRLSACRGAVPVATVWATVDDDSRLEAVVRDLQERADAVLSGA